MAMRAAVLWVGMFAVMAIQPAIEHPATDDDRAIPLFIQHGDQWICVDRNPRQVNRQDCWPRQSSSQH